MVVFDLVEDHTDRRWMAQARADRPGFPREGFRLFTVAITRTKTRLYLIGSRRRIVDAAPVRPSDMSPRCWARLSARSWPTS